MNYHGTTFVSLPDSLFFDTDDAYSEDEDKRNTVLAGNMSDWWDRV